MQNQTEYEAAYVAGQDSKIDVLDINGVPHASIPRGRTLTSLENFMEKPRRIQAHLKCSDIDGFKDYIEEFKTEGSRIFVDDDNHRFTIVFDGNAKDAPDWCDHRATLSLHHSPEWQQISNCDNQYMEAGEFAEFVENNLDYVSAGELSAADLLTMCQSFRIKLKGDIEVEDSLHSGLRTLVVKDDSTAQGRNAAGQEISFPEKIGFKLRIFKNQGAYNVPAYLRWRKRDNKLYIKYNIINKPGVIEHAFNDVVDGVRDSTGLPLLFGSFK